MIATSFLLPLLLAAQAGQVQVQHDGHAYNPHWSPDGKWLAFEVNQYGDAVDLYVVKIVSGNAGVPQKVVIPGLSSSFSSRGSVVAGPVWHPQGHVVFEGSNSGGTQRLYYWTPGGQAAAELLTQAQVKGDLTWPTLSADGMRLAFVSDASGNGDLYLWSQQDNQVQPTFSSPLAEAAPRFSPDRTMLAFTRKNKGSEDLFLWHGPGSEPTMLRGGNGDQTRPIWAGENILYFTNERGELHWDIAITDKAGTSRRILARDVRLSMRAGPALTPDGRAVAYTMSDPERADRIMITTLDGAKTVEIPTGLVACGEPDLVEVGGRVFLAFTALPNAASDFRQLHILEVTGRLP
ncbi:MAG: PD40 domain-containing protein [Deltaproteobacteria bacterium]|nr:PD40 domain-containing protein [Deltaproteobacteria bacterium]